MSNEAKKFEEHGLKIDKDRILTYSQLSCPLGCRYCFVDELNFSPKDVGEYLTTSQIDILRDIPEEVKIIMIGCDTEFFLNKADSLRILNELAKLGRDISVITKLALDAKFIGELAVINEKLSQSGNSLFFSVTIPCLESATIWEPNAPKPEARVTTLIEANEARLPTLVAIRPLLPTVSEDELRRIVTKTRDYCMGFYSGPLYLKDINSGLLPDNTTGELQIERVEPHWMPSGNIFYKIERRGQMDLLRNLVISNGRLLFEGAAEAINHIKENEKH